jgi:hypothetical protein
MFNIEQRDGCTLVGLPSENASFSAGGESGLRYDTCPACLDRGPGYDESQYN